jgi:hypothetical protein
MPAAHLHAKFHKLSVGGAYAAKDALQNTIFSVLAEHLHDVNHSESITTSRFGESCTVAQAATHLCAVSLLVP